MVLSEGETCKEAVWFYAICGVSRTTARVVPTRQKHLLQRPSPLSYGHLPTPWGAIPALRLPWIFVVSVSALVTNH